MEPNLPKPFNGEKTELKRFLQETRDYLTMNKEMYNDDEKKIGFILSFMDEGDAGAWKEKFISHAMIDAERRGEELSFGTLEDFKENFKKSFFPDATPKNTDDKNSNLRWQKILRRFTGKPDIESKPIEPKKPLFPKKERNPNNTNIDWPSIEDRSRLMKQGRCFKCRKHGHQLHDCPPDKESKKWDGKSTASHIKTLIDELDEEEREKFRESAEEEGLDFLKRKTTSTPLSPSLDIYSVVANVDSQSMNIPMSILHDNGKTIETDSLLDCGAGGVFIDQNYARRIHLDIKMLEIPVMARNMDGTENKQGTIRSYVDLQFKLGDNTFEERFYITGLGKQKIILGFPC
jgi:hypothetical protein